MIFKHFSKARKGEFAQVFVCPPGWDYAFVTDPEFFEDWDEAVTVKRQTWKLIDEVEVTFHPRTELCHECAGEGVHPDTLPGMVLDCLECAGTGEHPLAGQIEITAPEL